MDKSSRTNRAIKGVATSFIQYFIMILMQFLATPIILHVAGKEVLGSYSFIMQVVNWAGLVDLGFGIAIGRSLAQAHGSEDGHGQFRKVFTIGRTYYLVIYALFSAIVVAISQNISAMISMQPDLQAAARDALLVLAAVNMAKAPFALYGEALNATQNMAAINMIGVFCNALRLALSIGLVCLGYGLVGLITAFVAADLAIVLAQWAVYRLKFRQDRMGFGFSDSKELKSLILFGLTFMLMQMAGRLSSNTDSILVGVTMGAAAVAVYYPSQIPGTLLYMLIWRISDSIQAGLNDLFARNEFAKIRNVYIRVMRIALAMAFGLMGGLVLFNAPLVGVWVGPSLFAGQEFTVFLALYAVVQVVNYQNTRVLIVFGKIKALSAVGVACGLLKLAIGFILLKAIGLPGLMLAFVLSDMPTLAYSQVKSLRLIGLEARTFFAEVLAPVGKVMLLPAVAAAGLLIVRSYNLFTLAAAALAYMLLWAVGFYRYCLSADEKGKLLSKLHLRGSKA